MSDHTWEPSAQGIDGNGLGLLDELLEADGVKKQVALLNSDHVAGSRCPFNGDVWCWRLHAVSTEFAVWQDSEYEVLDSVGTLLGG